MKILNKLMSGIQKIIMKGPIREGGRNAHVDWIVILFLSIVLTIILVINGIYLLKRINEGDIKGSGLRVATTTEVFDAKSLDYIIEKFKIKEATYITIKRSYQTVSDPSI